MRTRLVGERGGEVFSPTVFERCGSNPRRDRGGGGRVTTGGTITAEHYSDPPYSSAGGPYALVDPERHRIGQPAARRGIVYGHAGGARCGDVAGLNFRRYTAATDEGCGAVGAIPLHDATGHEVRAADGKCEARAAVRGIGG